jgi:hypothetical protein
MDLRFRSVKRMFVMQPIKKHDPRHGPDYAAKSSDEPSSSHVYPAQVKSCLSQHGSEIGTGKRVNTTTRGLGLMSELGHQRTSPRHFRMSALPPKADITESHWHVR